MLFPIVGLASVLSAVSKIDLGNGHSITGEVLLDRSDRLVVDLGFSVLTIPREAVVSVSDEKRVDSSLVEVDFFSESSNNQFLPVKDWVDVLGEAVVLIRTNTGLGSGFFVRSDGYIITNHHVIAGENAITVTVFQQQKNELNRKIYENVRIVATNAALDLALLKIDATDPQTAFATVPLGDSDQLKQGQDVFAIGSPLGLERSVSQGIISIRNRPVGSNIFIQTTAEINPGNSGGPLFNLKGEVVGVNNMKIVTMGAEGLGFAIPANVLKMFLKNRDAYAFDPRNPNSGFRYNRPPSSAFKTVAKEKPDNT